VTFQAIARAIRPPSSGNAGTRLNTSRTRFIETSRETTTSAGVASALPESRAAAQKPSAPASTIAAPAASAMIARVTRGPAAATRNSAPGVSVSRLIFITPPNRNRSMPSTPIPSRRAASACPSSCSRIEAKKLNAETTATA
jgi:hypothetical protein